MDRFAKLLTFRKRKMMNRNDNSRVLIRMGARELTPAEIERVSGNSGTNCTFRTTHQGHIIDDLVDDCGPI
jgi:hypothetical protein